MGTAAAVKDEEWHVDDLPRHQTIKRRALKQRQQSSAQGSPSPKPQAFPDHYVFPHIHFTIV